MKNILILAFLFTLSFASAKSISINRFQCSDYQLQSVIESDDHIVSGNENLVLLYNDKDVAYNTSDNSVTVVVKTILTPAGSKYITQKNINKVGFLLLKKTYDFNLKKSRIEQYAYYSCNDKVLAGKTYRESEKIWDDLDHSTPEEELYNVLQQNFKIYKTQGN